MEGPETAQRPTTHAQTSPEEGAGGPLAVPGLAFTSGRKDGRGPRGNNGNGSFRFQEFDADYVERLRRGDPETERHFVEYFGALMLIKLRHRLRSRDLIADVRQESFLRVMRALKRPGCLRDPRCLGSFLNSVCNNVVLELVRVEGRHRPTAYEPDREASPDSDPEIRLVSEEHKALVRQTVQQLPERDQRLLRCLFLEKRDKDEICEEFRVSRDYLRVLLHRARLHFRSLYDE